MAAKRKPADTPPAETSVELEVPAVAAAELDDTGVPADVLARFVAAIKADTLLGNIDALRAAGVTGHKRDLRKLLDDDLLETARAARGWNIVRVENTIWDVALDKTHPHWERAASRLVKAYGGPQFRDHVDVGHSGQVEVTNSDVAAAVDRFAATIARLAARAGAEPSGDVRGAEPERAALPAGGASG